MLGLVLNQPAKDLQDALQAKGLLVLATAETVCRFLPPLNVNEADVRKAAATVAEACAVLNEKMQEVAEKVASRVFEAHQQLTFHDWVPLAAKQVNLKLTTRQPTAEMIDHLERVTNRTGDELKRRQRREEIYADRIAKILTSPKEIEVVLQAVSIGDLGIAAIPFETFAETGLELKQRSTMDQTFTIELANGSFGYLPTPEQHRLGGYETWLGTNFVQKDASTKIVATLLDLFRELSSGRGDGR